MSTTPTRDGPRLYTWHWRAALAYEGDDIVLVRTSLGKPKWASPTLIDALPYIGELAPQGCFHLKSDRAFTACYRRRLENFGVERLERRLSAVIENTGGLPLVLLCFETHPSQCHRGDFAAWWLEKTGEVVPEFDPTARVAPAEPAPAGLF